MTEIENLSLFYRFSGGSTTGLFFHQHRMQDLHLCNSAGAVVIVDEPMCRGENLTSGVRFTLAVGRGFEAFELGRFYRQDQPPTQQGVWFVTY